MKITLGNNVYVITNSNSSVSQHGSTRVKDSTGKILACVTIKGKSDPLGYIRRTGWCDERKEFVRQLRASGVPENAITELLRPTPTAYQLKVRAKREAINDSVTQNKELQSLYTQENKAK